MPLSLEQQVCNLELATKLKELGVKQKSLFWWTSFRNESSPKEQWSNIYNVIIFSEEKKDYKERSYLKDKKFYSAFTVAELGMMLPYRFGSNNYTTEWLASGPKGVADKMGCRSTTEADCRAKMVIYLIEQGHIDAISKS